jgi:hypothetical protein
MLFSPGKPGRFLEVTVIRPVAGMIPITQIQDFLGTFQDTQDGTNHNS